jgi:hypothetical protein
MIISVSAVRILSVPTVSIQKCNFLFCYRGKFIWPSTNTFFSQPMEEAMTPIWFTIASLQQNKEMF